MQKLNLASIKFLILGAISIKQELKIGDRIFRYGLRCLDIILISPYPVNQQGNYLQRYGFINLFTRFLFVFFFFL